MDAIDVIRACEGFQWDEGNAEKNQAKHRVSQSEIEQVFFNVLLIVGTSEQRMDQTPRYHALGITDDQRLLFIVFTIREKLIRVISAHPMSRKERRIFHHV